MKVLIADDDAVTRRLLSATLEKWDYEVVTAAEGGEALAALTREGAPSLAILDWQMPVIDGMDVCRKLRLRDGPYVYVILLTARDQKQDVVDGLLGGADDYLVKPFDPHELDARIRAGRRILDLQSALLAAQEKLREQATHDVLTGLWNRAGILELLERELSAKRRHGGALGVILADVDRFKTVNDTFGHEAGDEVLREVSRRLLQSARRSDAVGRYGGEELLIVVPRCELATAQQTAERLRLAVSGEPMAPGGVTATVSISLGVALSSQFPSAGSSGLVRAADVALYRAKAAGRNRVELARDGDALVVSPGVGRG